MNLAADLSLAVVIVNFNGGDMLHRCLSALQSQTVQGFEVVVVDNASTDHSVNQLDSQFPNIKLIKSNLNLGFAGGNNVALQHIGQVRWVLLLNPDAYPAPDCLQQLLAAAQCSPFDFFGCKMHLADIPQYLDGTGDVYHVSGMAWRRDHGRKAGKSKALQGEIFAPCAAAALYRKADLDAVHGFDEHYFCYFEDIDLAFRLRLQGKRCEYIPQAVVYHVSSGIAGKRSDFASYHGHRNMVWTYFKNMPNPLFWLYLPAHLAVNLMALIVCMARGQAKIALKAKCDALLGLPRILAQRKAIQAHKKITARKLHRALAHGLLALWRRP
jgi:GT2 family glycosyltransferase